MKSINLKQCLKVIQLQGCKKNNESLHIGLLSEDAPDHIKQIYGKSPLLFKRSCYDHGTVTIEKPMSDEDLERQKLTGSLLTTICTMVGVPEQLIIEILI